MNDRYSIEISEPTNPLPCDNIINPYRKKQKDLTPDFCISFLKKTNNRKNIRDLLKLISENLNNNPNSYKEYRVPLYAVISNREQPKDIVNNTAEIILKHINLQKVDNFDRGFMIKFSKANMPLPISEKINNLSEQILEKVPVDIDDIAEQMVAEINNNKDGKIDDLSHKLTEQAIQEVAKKNNKNNILKRLFNKIKSR